MQIRSINDIHRRQMDFITASFKVCEVSSCRLLVRKAGELLCKKHLSDFCNDFATRNTVVGEDEMPMQCCRRTKNGRLLTQKEHLWAYPLCTYNEAGRGEECPNLR